MNAINHIMPKLLKNIDLTTTESENVFKYLISGEASDVETAAFLSTLSMKGLICRRTSRCSKIIVSLRNKSSKTQN